MTQFVDYYERKPRGINDFQITGFILNIKEKQTRAGKNFLTGICRTDKYEIPFACFNQKAIKILKNGEGVQAKMEGGISVYKNMVNLNVNKVKL